MRILFLTQVVPYLLVVGPKIKTWHVLRHLGSSDHEIASALFVHKEEWKGSFE